ncbi:MAG TPA: TetR/AcrR family transcriptional regulator [Jiangellaceae bacterium]
MECAIETIAEVGYGQASFTRIAARAGLSSTRLISYHFAGKDDLTSEILRTVVERFADFVRPRVAAQETASGALRAFIESNADFIRSHRGQLMVALDIARNTRLPGGQRMHDASGVEADLVALAELFRRGQQAGEFRQFDPRIMATFVLALRNDLVAAYAADPELDLHSHVRELTTVIERATGA